MASVSWSWTTRFLFLFVGVVWGFNFLFIRVGLADASPLWLSLLRAAVGTAATAVVLTPLHAWHELDARGRRDALLLGIPNTMAFYALLFVALQSELPGIAAVLTYTFPLWVALLSPSVLGHRLGARHWVAVGAGFLGVGLISQPWSAAANGLALPPILETLGAAVAWATGTVLFQRRFPRNQMLEANAFQLIGGTAGLAVLVVLLAPTPYPTLTPDLGLSLIWLGVLGTALAYSIWFDLLGRTRAATLSAYAFLVPVVALVGSAVFFGEHLSPVQIAGVVLVLVSIYFIGRAEGAAVPVSEALPTPPE
jgi:probable blue pigment (indigoidine) exporter